MRFNSSKPDHWTVPRPYQDASMRYRMHGPIQPMDYGINPRRELAWGAVGVGAVCVFLAGLWIATP